MKKLLLILLLTFIASIALAAKPIPNPRPTVTRLKLPPFSAIRVVGHIKLIIRGTRSNNPRDTLIESRNPQWVDARVKNHTLYLRALRAALPSRRPALVKVKMYRLNKLKVYGHASVQGTNIRSNGLVIKTQTTGNVTLNGKLFVDKVKNKGPGNVSLRWIKGDNISIKAEGTGRITLTGTARKIKVDLEDHAKLNAKALRVKDVMVKTDDYAIARVSAINSLSAFAEDHSNIYYYNTPRHITRYTKNSGNILRMGSQR